MNKVGHTVEDWGTNERVLTILKSVGGDEIVVSVGTVIIGFDTIRVGLLFQEVPQN